MKKVSFIALMLSFTFLTACQLTAPAEEVTTEETPVVEEVPAVEVPAVEVDAVEVDAAMEKGDAAMEAEVEADVQ